MVVEFKNLLQIDDKFTDAEARYVNKHTLDQLLISEYKIWPCPYETISRPGPGNGEPYLTREGFSLLFLTTIIRDPASTTSSSPVFCGVLILMSP